MAENGIDIWFTTEPEGLLPEDQVSEMLSNNLLSLPIDQRYGASEMQLLVELVTAYLSSAGLSARSG